jgi:hypothetical protein
MLFHLLLNHLLDSFRELTLLLEHPV